MRVLACLLLILMALNSYAAEKTSENGFIKVTFIVNNVVPTCNITVPESIDLGTIQIGEQKTLTDTLDIIMDCPPLSNSSGSLHTGLTAITPFLSTADNTKIELISGTFMTIVDEANQTVVFDNTTKFCINDSNGLCKMKLKIESTPGASAGWFSIPVIIKGMYY